LGAISSRRESGLDRLDGILFVLIFSSRVEDRRRRRRLRAALDEKINTNHEHPSDQGRHALRLRMAWLRLANRPRSGFCRADIFHLRE